MYHFPNIATLYHSLPTAAKLPTKQSQKIMAPARNEAEEEESSDDDDDDDEIEVTKNEAGEEEEEECTDLSNS